MTDAPRCRSCKTDEHLEYSDYQPGHWLDVSARVHQGGRVLPKRRWVGPVVSFTCQQCGSFNGHTVPNDWAPPGGW